MPYAHVRGVDLYCEQHGSGPTLVVLHGLMAGVATAEASSLGAAELAAHGLQVVAFDARGHGRSGHGTRAADYRWAALAKDLEALLDALDIEQRFLKCSASSLAPKAYPVVSDDAGAVGKTARAEHGAQRPAEFGPYVLAAGAERALDTAPPTHRRGRNDVGGNASSVRANA